MAKSAKAAGNDALEWGWTAARVTQKKQMGTREERKAQNEARLMKSSNGNVGPSLVKTRPLKQKALFACLNKM